MGAFEGATDARGAVPWHIASPRRAALVALLVLALVAGAVVGLRVWRADAGSPARAGWAGALALLPADTTVVGFTDWAAVRAAGLDEPGDRDVLTRSVLADEERLEEVLGWTGSDVATETYAQSPTSVSLVIEPSGASGVGAMADVLAAAGWRERADGTLTIDSADLAALGLSDVLTFVRPLPERGVLVASPIELGVDAVVDVAAGRAPSLTSVRAALDVARALSGAHSALLQAGTLACESTAVADPAVADQVQVAQERAGRLADYTFSGRAVTDRGGSLEDPRSHRARFAMAFESVGTAREQARVRAALATGPFIGRTGQIEDLLRLRDREVTGSAAVLTFDRAAGDGALMTGTGPLLFAACP